MEEVRKSFAISIILLFLSELSSLTAVAVTIGNRKNALGELAPRRTDSDGFDSRSIKASMMKIVGTLGPKSRSVEIISSCLELGMPDAEFHQETLENLRTDVKKSKKLCAVMLDTGGPELQVVNKSEHPISLQADSLVVLTPDQDKEVTPNHLPINFSGLSKSVKKGDTIFIGQYSFTGSETTSVWLG
uniref:pyruvate kinase n=1 Tax=Solanum tuberosum TaxID=4113 RepID=M1CM03_SOLTU